MDDLQKSKVEPQEAQPAEITPAEAPQVETQPSTVNTAEDISSPSSSSKNHINPLVSWSILAFIVIAIGGGVAVMINNSQPTSTSVAIPQVQPAFALTLDSPKDSDIIADNQVKVSGKTSPNTAVVFYTETDDNSVQSDANGQFEGTIMLQGGINTLTVQAFSDSGEEKNITFDLVYDDTTQIMGAKTLKDAPGQVKKETESPNKAVIGNVERVTSNSLFIDDKKTKKKIEANVDAGTKITGQAKKVLKLDTIKPNDKAAIIASGSSEATNGAQIKKVAKIFVKQATSSAQSKRQAISGIITGIQGNLITLTHRTQRDRSYNLLTNDQTVVKIKNANGALADLAVGQIIAAVGDLNEQGLLVAKRIHVIPGKATGIFQRQPLSTPSGNIATPTATATPSATPSTTQEATPTATPITSATPTTEPTPTL